MTSERKGNAFEFPKKIISNTIMRVTYRDTDQMGFVYYSNYLVWFEIGRTELLRRCGKSYNLIEKEGIILPVRYSDCEYIKSFKYDELVRIETIIEELTKISMTFKYNLYFYPDNILYASGSTKHIFITPEGKVQRAGDKIFEILKSCQEKVIEDLLIPMSNI